MTSNRDDQQESTQAAAMPYTAGQVLSSLNDGVYVTDLERRIVYWNPAAERITGWPAAAVLGRTCYDNVLCHTDKEGRQLCGKEQCPLHRSMVTDHGSLTPALVFAQGKDGRRIAVQVSVAPIHDEQGRVIGGVEIFRDASARVRDLERAQSIQRLSMQMPPDDNPRLRFAVQYLPHDIIGGDFYTVEKLDQDRYAFCLVDVMGHGTAAGLYAMHLHSLWESNRRALDHPATFVGQLNRSLCQLVRDNESFATGIFGLIDLRSEAIALCAAGSPSLILTRHGHSRQIKISGLPLGMIGDHVYEVTLMQLEAGDGLLFYTDGATEITDREDEMLGGGGLTSMVDRLGFPASEKALARLVEQLLRFSNSVIFPDDLTMLAISYQGRRAAAGEHPSFAPSPTPPESIR